jgi:carbon-monoxide dehydrogenase medium subunit
MPRPDYYDPQRLDEVHALLAQYGDDAKLVAGGQSLMVMLRQGLIEPTALIDLARVPGLAGIERHNGTIRVGAMTTIRTLETDATVRRALPTLAQAAAAVGPMQIRNMGTVGGNASHNALGADPPPALLALDAEATIAGPDGERRVPLEEFFTGYFETCLRPTDVMTALTIAAPGPDVTGAYLKFASRAVDMSIVGIAVVLAREGARVREARIAIGGAGPVPFRARQAEAALRGTVWGDAALREAGVLAAEEASPLGDIHASAAYRRWLVRALVPRALNAAAEGTDPQRGRR